MSKEQEISEINESLQVNAKLSLFSLNPHLINNLQKKNDGKKDSPKFCSYTKDTDSKRNDVMKAYYTEGSNQQRKLKPEILESKQSEVNQSHLARNIDVLKDDDEIEYEKLRKETNEKTINEILKRRQELDNLINDLKADSDDEVVDKIKNQDIDLTSELSDIQNLSLLSNTRPTDKASSKISGSIYNGEYGFRPLNQKNIVTLKFRI